MIFLIHIIQSSKLISYNLLHRQIYNISVLGNYYIGYNANILYFYRRCGILNTVWEVEHVRSEKILF